MSPTPPVAAGKLKVSEVVPAAAYWAGGLAPATKLGGLEASTAPIASLSTCCPSASVAYTRIKYDSPSTASLTVMLPGAVPLTLAPDPGGAVSAGGL